MKFIIERSKLLPSLAHVQSVVERRNTIPILSNVLLRAENGKLSLSATDMDLEIVESVPAEIAKPGATTAPAHTLYDIVRKLQDGSNVEFETNADSGVLSVRGGRSNFRLGCLPTDDFPQMAGSAMPVSFTLGAADLRTLIDRARFAISTEETRYYLNGIYLHAAKSGDVPVLACCEPTDRGTRTLPRPHGSRPHQGSPSEAPASRDFEHDGPGWAGRAAWAVVGLGVLLRVARYALDFPLWWDEAFVAVNLLRRDYAGLLRPLDYGQVCPLLFLWVERAVVGICGFSEWSLRAFPMACAIGGVVLFRHAAGRVLGGLPLLMATAIFAVAYHPIQHAADVKPYASDLLASLVLTAVALEWLRRPERVAWLWGLAAAGPIAVALSHPAAFVAGGVGLALAGPAWKAGWRARAALAGFGAASAGTFAALYLIFTHAQARATLPAMGADWAGSFPPLGSPIALGRWLVRVHAGSMLAYPAGGEGGGSLATLAMVALGAAVLWRSRRRAALGLCLLPLAVAMVAAALRRYPYGGSANGASARVMQYAAPGICLLAGLGAAALLESLRRPRARGLAIGSALLGLAAVGLVPAARDVMHPYRAVPAQRARDFARRFWPEVGRGAEVACLRWDFGVGGWDSIHLGRPVALCNQAIYSPARRAGGPRWDAISADHPLRCVLADARPADGPAVASWLEGMAGHFDLRDRRAIVADLAEPGARPRPERYEVFEFAPQRGARPGPVSGPAASAPGGRRPPSRSRRRACR